MDIDIKALEKEVFGEKPIIEEDKEEVKVRKPKPPVWVDPDDLSVIIKPELQSNEGETYADVLREKFAQAKDGIDASWAQKSSESKPQTIDGSSVFSDDSSRLPSDILHITRIANLFESGKGHVRINDLVFDPSQERAAILDNSGAIHFMTANPKHCSEQATLQPIGGIPRFCLCFTRDGAKLIAGCGRGNFHVIDSRTYQIDVCRIPSASIEDLKHIYCSPDNTTLIMISDRKVHFLDCQTRRLIKTITSSDVLFCGDFSDDGLLFIAAGSNGCGLIFNVQTKNPIGRFQEPERQNIKSLAISRGRVAIGTEAGILHIFDIDSIKASPYPAPLFTKMNLTTAIDTAVFHPSGEMLVFASSGKKDSLRVLHIGARKVFSNWPTKQTPLSYVRKVAFDAKGQFLSFGTDKGSCLLWELPFYAQ